MPPSPPPAPDPAPIPAVNAAPVFTSGATSAVSENFSGVVYRAAATDADGDALTYALSGADAGLFNIDRTTGAVLFRTAPDFERPADADGDNQYALIVSASDGVATASQAVVIAVGNVNDNAPVISSANDSGGAADTSPRAGGTIAFVDGDLSDTHAVSAIAAGPDYVGDFSAVVANASNGVGVINWSFAADAGALLYLAAGETVVQQYNVTLSDGVTSVVQAVTITITGTNQGPEVQGAAQVAGVDQDNASTFGAISFSDVDLSDSHAVSVSPGASGYLGVFSVAIGNAATGDGAGRVDWTFAVDASVLHYLGAGETMTQTYAVTVVDSHGVSAVQMVTIHLNGQNDAPTVSGSMIATNQSMAVAGHLAASDIEGGALSFSMQGAPQHGTLTLQASGAYVYTPADGYSGADAFTFAVRDDDGGITSGTVIIDVARGETRVDYLAGAQEGVSEGLGGAHSYPQVAALAGGGHVVTWTAIGADVDGLAHEVYVQRYDAAGEKLGAAILVENNFSYGQSLPTVAALGDGGFLLVWQGYHADGSGLGLFGQRYDADGAKTGDEIIVNANGFLEPHDASVTVLANGGFAVSWTANALTDGTYDIWARVFDAQGAPVGPDFFVNTIEDGIQRTQGRITEAIAGLDGGRFAVVFVDEAGADGSGAGVYVR
ncbi:MAG: hypothetical protein EOP61_21110, partial [Sphingomonadales bacterium]